MQIRRKYLDIDDSIIDHSIDNAVNTFFPERNPFLKKITLHDVN